MSGSEIHPAVIDRQPEMVMNAAAVAEAVRQSPLGVEKATEALRRFMSPEHFALVEEELQ